MLDNLSGLKHLIKEYYKCLLRIEGELKNSKYTNLDVIDINEYWDDLLMTIHELRSNKDKLLKNIN